MTSPGGPFPHQNRLLALSYATPRRQYAVVRRHRPWAGDVLFVGTFFGCVLSVLFVVTLVAHVLFDALLF
jgi:hypothetical protein